MQDTAPFGRRQDVQDRPLLTERRYPAYPVPSVCEGILPILCFYSGEFL